MTTPNPTEAVVHVDIEAEPHDVWEALATDEGLARWIGQGSTIGNEVGEEIRVHDVVTGRDRRGFLDEVTPGRRIGYTWWPDAEPDQATRVAITLEPTTTGTRVTVVESQPLVSSGSSDRAPQASAAHQATSVLPCRWTWRMALLCVATTPQMAQHRAILMSHG